ncbi:MAG: hypothetical protein AAF993_11495 [Pseudomonadota bacterium]
MRRLYYLAEDLSTTEAIAERLRADGISDWNFHVLAKDANGLYTHHIHSALAHHQKDIIRTGEVGAIYGAVLFGLLAAAMLFAGVFSWLSSWVDVALWTFVGGVLGGIQGARRGAKKEHFRLAAFHDDIERGCYLIMVDVRKEDKARIRELMNMEFEKVAYHGNASTIIRPFKTDERILPQPSGHHRQLSDPLI